MRFVHVTSSQRISNESTTFARFILNYICNKRSVVDINEYP